MDKVNGKLTVFFEEPFWVGIFERIEDGKLSVAKVTFGAEPKDYEVQEYIQKCYFCCKGYQKKSETDAAGSKEADAGNRHWYKIATGVEITAGTEQAGTQREKPQEKSTCNYVSCRINHVDFSVRKKRKTVRNS